MSAQYNASRTIRVALVDDDLQLRESFTNLVYATPGLYLAGCYTTPEQAVKSAQRHQPDVVIADLNLIRSSDGACLTRELRVRLPDVRVLIHTHTSEASRVLEALGAGVVGYLLKSEPAHVLIRAIHEVMDGGSPLSAKIARYLVDSVQRSVIPNVKSNLQLLTSREMEILSAAAQGVRNKELATLFKLSTETVRNHMRHVFNKLQVKSRTEAAAIYWQSIGHLQVEQADPVVAEQAVA